MIELLELDFVRRGLVIVAVLSVPAGILGTWIVLRGLAFYSHAVGTATYPGLVVASAAGVSPPVGAMGAAAAFSLVSAFARRDRRLGVDATTALVLSGFLALGVVLASNVFTGEVGSDQLLFGSLFLVGPVEGLIALAVLLATVAGNYLLGARWLAAGFDPELSSLGRLRARWEQVVLLALTALVATAILPVLGAMLAGALVVLPAATARLLASRIHTMQAAAIAIAAAVGTVGVLASVELNTAPGPTVAVASAMVFGLATALRAFGGHLHRDRVSRSTT